MKTWHAKRGRKAATQLSVGESLREYIVRPSTETREVEWIRSGISYPQIRVVQNAYHASDKVFAHLIGISDKTLMRLKKSNAKLSALSGDRLYRLKKTWELANKVLEDGDAALAWLRRPQPGLGGQTPLDLLDTEPGYEQVQTLLNQLEYGVLP